MDLSVDGWTSSSSPEPVLDWAKKRGSGELRFYVGRNASETQLVVLLDVYASRADYPAQTAFVTRSPWDVMPCRLIECDSFRRNAELREEYVWSVRVESPNAIHYCMSGRNRECVFPTLWRLVGNCTLQVSVYPSGGTADAPAHPWTVDEFQALVDEVSASQLGAALDGDCGV